MHFCKNIFVWFAEIFCCLIVKKKIEGNRIMSADLSFSKVLEIADKNCTFIY